MYPVFVNSFLALIWLFCGLCFLRSPAHCARRLGYPELGPEALVDIRASFGGVCLAIGIGSFALALAGRLDNALWMQIILLSGYACGRGLGLVLKAGAPSPHRHWLLAEITLLIFALSGVMPFPGGS
jgi:hypothetical protein